MEFEFDLEVSLIVLIVALLLYYIKTTYSSGNLQWPPGPKGLPFIGFLIYFVSGKDYPKRLLQLKQKYGKIATVQMGSFKCIFLNDYRLIRKAWANPKFCSRPEMPATLDRTSKFTPLKAGIIFNTGKDYDDQRRFTVKTLKEFGMGDRNLMESLILEEVVELIRNLKLSNSEAIPTTHLFHIASLNALWHITTGKKVSHDHVAIKRITALLSRNLELNHGAKAAIFMPWLTKLFPSLSGWTQYVNDSNEIYHFWLTYARQRIEDYKSNPVSDSFVHAYLNEVENCKDPKSGFYKSNAEFSLASVLQDLFIAGMETTSTTLSWSFLLLSLFQEVQETVYNEIKSVIGEPTERLPSLTDRDKMPYTEATIHEILRFSSLAPLGFLHSVTEDINFGGYDILKDTIVLSNISAIHRDPEYWGDPENFRPERWLNPDKTLIRHDSYLPFSHGKRKCIGEFLAKDELFLFITGVIQVFKVVCSKPPSSLIPDIGVSAVPKPHLLKYFERISVK